MRRFVVNQPPVEIVRPAVTKIVEASGLGLTVHTAVASQFVFIPEQLVQFQSVRAELAPTALEPPAAQRGMVASEIAFSLLVLALWLATGLVSDIRLAMFAGVLLVACLVYAPSSYGWCSSWPCSRSGSFSCLV